MLCQEKRKEKNYNAGKDISEKEFLFLFLCYNVYISIFINFLLIILYSHICSREEMFYVEKKCRNIAL